VIWLQDSPANCLERIRRRSRPYEQGVTLAFLEALDSDYRRMFDEWKTCPVLRVPAARLTGYAEAVVEHLIVQVRAYIATKTESGEATQNRVCGGHASSNDNR
jgi:deoxyadenosine/deoxycytidine kinase